MRFGPLRAIIVTCFLIVAGTIPAISAFASATASARAEAVTDTGSPDQAPTATDESRTLLFPELLSLGQTTVRPSTDNESGLVRVDFTVTLDILFYQTVTYRPSFDLRWNHTIVPDQLVFKTDGTQPFSVLVTTPPQTGGSTEVASYSYELTIEPSGVTIPSSVLSTFPIEDAILSIGVERYYEIEIATDERWHTTERGQRVAYPLTITNHGNSDDVFNVTVPNRYRLKQAGVSIELSNTSLEIRSGESATVTIWVETDAGTDPRTYSINVTVEGAYGVPAVGSIDLELEVTRPLTERVIVPLAIIGAAAGGAAAIVIVVRYRRRQHSVVSQPDH